MSKAALYGIISAFLVLTGSVTYFFPVISNINALFNNTAEKNTISTEKSYDLNKVESQIEIKDESTASYLENPSVKVSEDSLNLISSDENYKNPLKSEMLQDELPTKKSF
ncbi:MAG: hypothetical protein JNL75_09090 [Chitinophagales bacterium]|nr:hypothetical protein [Chitinophagales bacterium]